MISSTQGARSVCNQDTLKRREIRLLYQQNGEIKVFSDKMTGCVPLNKIKLLCNFHFYWYCTNNRLISKQPQSQQIHQTYGAHWALVSVQLYQNTQLSLEIWQNSIICLLSLTWHTFLVITLSLSKYNIFVLPKNCPMLSHFEC